MNLKPNTMYKVYPIQPGQAVLDAVSGRSNRPVTGLTHEVETHMLAGLDSDPNAGFAIFELIGIAERPKPKPIVYTSVGDWVEAKGQPTDE